MDKDKIISFIESSFLKELLEDKEITDISYNGSAIFYQHNFFGRKQSDIIINQTEARDFIRQIANLTEQQFSYQIPQLDVSIGKYRINAIHQSIGRVLNNPSLTFSIRIASDTLRIKDTSDFMPYKLSILFDLLIKSHCSIVIGGITGSGKTEFQKYLLCKIPNNERIIVIDNVLELDQIRFNNNIDLNSWQVDERNEYASMESLIRNALRSNPDWLIVAESRGKEMLEVLNSAMTGHPIITTIHSLSLETMPHRIARMIMMNDKKSSYSEIENDANFHFKFYVFLEKKTDSEGMIKRYVSKVGEILPTGEINLIYERKGEKHFYRKVSLDNQSLLRKDLLDSKDQIKEMIDYE